MQRLAVCMCTYAYYRAHIYRSICKSQPGLRLHSLTDDGKYNVKAHLFIWWVYQIRVEMLAYSMTGLTL